MSLKRILLGMIGGAAVLISALYVGSSMIAESSFKLADDSRLPKWITIPDGLTREQVTIRLDYYSGLFGRKATFTLIGPDMGDSARISGAIRGDMPHPASGKASKIVSYPIYQFISADGVWDIVEHRKMEPLFYLSDDPELWRRLAEEAGSMGQNN